MDPKLNQASGAIVDLWPTCGQDPLLVKQAMDPKLKGKWSHSWCKNYKPVAMIPCWSRKPIDPQLDQASGATVDVWTTYLFLGSSADQASQWIPGCGQVNAAIVDVWTTYLWPGSPADQAGQWILGYGQVNAAPVIVRLLCNFRRSIIKNSHAVLWTKNIFGWIMKGKPSIKEFFINAEF